MEKSASELLRERAKSLLDAEYAKAVVRVDDLSWDLMRQWYAEPLWDGDTCVPVTYHLPLWSPRYRGLSESDYEELEGSAGV